MTSLENDLLLLSPYAVATRYDDALTPGIEDARSALDTASRMHDLADQLIAAESGGT